LTVWLAFFFGRVWGGEVSSICILFPFFSRSYFAPPPPLEPPPSDDFVFVMNGSVGHCRSFFPDYARCFSFCPQFSPRPLLSPAHRLVIFVFGARDFCVSPPFRFVCFFKGECILAQTRVFPNVLPHPFSVSFRGFLVRTGAPLQKPCDNPSFSSAGGDFFPHPVFLWNSF